jgi:membrane-associated protease RseP (regulator of RpoE activity)
MRRTSGLLPVLALLALLVSPSFAFAHDPSPPERWEGFMSGVWESFGHPKGRLGIEVLPMTPELRQYFAVGPEAGVLVAKVEPESPAADARLRAGDVILAADGRAIHTPHELVQLVGRFPADEKLKIELSREGKEKELELVPRGRPRSEHWAGEEVFRPWMGKAFRELREQMRELEHRLRELEERFGEDELSDGADRT